MKKLILIFTLTLCPVWAICQTKKVNDSLYVYFYDSRSRLDSAYIAKPYESQGLRAVEQFNNAKDNKVMGIISKVFFAAAFGAYVTLKK